MITLDDRAASHSVPLAAYLGLLFISAAVLLFEINLVRISSVSQFYHFAFLIVSIAMLGSGAGGTLLSILPKDSRLLNPAESKTLVPILSLGTGVVMLVSYLFINQVPFDSFRAGQQPFQWGILGTHYLILALPFFLTGIIMGVFLSSAPEKARKIYGANLLGSAVGCVFALIFPVVLGGEGIVVFSSILAALTCLVFSTLLNGHKILQRKIFSVVTVSACIWITALLPDLSLRMIHGTGYPMLSLHLSPYKSLSYATQVPQAEIIFQKWNAYSRVDVVRSQNIHSLPGLSFRYLETLPAEVGLLIDGDNLNPLLAPRETWSDDEFTRYLLPAVVYEIKPEADVLILDARAGLDIFTAQALGAKSVTAVEANPLIIEAAPQVYGIENPSTFDIKTIVEQGRSYLRRSKQRYDIIVIPLINSYHPVRSGAYSLGEDYRYTVEAFTDALQRLNAGGILVVSRWLQNPPSESLRTFALAVTALENIGGDPYQQIAVLRSYNMITFLLSSQPFSGEALQILRQFSTDRAFDMVLIPGLKPDEINQFNILSEPVYEKHFTLFLEAQPRSAFYLSYPYDVHPPTDDRPFFSHYFKWSQVKQVLDEMGKTWQPFGGAGYFVLLALLVMAVFFAGILIILPSLFLRHKLKIVPVRKTVPVLVYFGCIGMAYLMIEIPLIQKFILYLGNPAFSVNAVLFSLLFLSGIGSQLSSRIDSLRIIVALLGVLVLLLSILPWSLPVLLDLTLGQPLTIRIFLTVLFLSPAGLLMGLPFPSGVRLLYTIDPSTSSPWIGWAWGINSAASVVASVLASLLALSFGFQRVFTLGAISYAAGFVMFSISYHSTRSRDIAV